MVVKRLMSGEERRVSSRLTQIAGCNDGIGDDTKTLNDQDVVVWMQLGSQCGDVVMMANLLKEAQLRRGNCGSQNRA